MIIKLKNKDTLICDDFQFKCSIGKNGLKKNKLEGDNCTPKGTFSLGPVYYRNDRVDKPITKLKNGKISLQNCKKMIQIVVKCMLKLLKYPSTPAVDPW